LKLLWEFTSGDADASSALSLTEVHFMRFVLEHSCGDKISRGKDKDYKEAQLNELDTFLERSGIWDQVWDFEGTNTEKQNEILPLTLNQVSLSDVAIFRIYGSKSFTWS